MQRSTFGHPHTVDRQGRGRHPERTVAVLKIRALDEQFLERSKLGGEVQHCELRIANLVAFFRILAFFRSTGLPTFPVYGTSLLHLLLALQALDEPGQEDA